MKEETKIKLWGLPGSESKTDGTRGESTQQIKARDDEAGMGSRSPGTKHGVQAGHQDCGH